MANLQQLRRRIKSIDSIHQITRTMEMIATSKMQKATKKAINSRDYSISAKEILSRLNGNIKNPLLEVREEKNISLIFITSDRGLCGAFNSSLFRELVNFMKNVNSAGQKVSMITVGKKGRDFVMRHFRDNFTADFSNIKDEILYEEITPISSLVIRDFLNKNSDKVYIIYSQFISSFLQKPNVMQVLPVAKEAGAINDYLLEPSPKILLETLLPQFIEVQIYQALLESKASEHSARMVAMQNATENAKDLMDELYLTYHSTRQATITSELTEMVVAKQAME